MPSGWEQAEVIALRYNRDEDIAVLAIKGNHDIPCYSLYDGKGSEQAEVLFCGYRGKKYAETKGTFKYTNGTLNRYRGLVHEGMSGGPAIVMVDGIYKTVGVIVGYGNRIRAEAAISSLRLIRATLGPLQVSPRCRKMARPKQRQPTKPTPNLTIEIDYNKLAILIIARMKEDGSFRGEKGATGDTGSPGEQGETGSDGSSGKQSTLDYDKLVKAVIEKLPPFRMEIQHPNGEVKYQEKKLGEIIAIKLVPVK